MNNAAAPLTGPDPGFRARLPEWGRLTWARDALLCRLAQPAQAGPREHRACTILKLDRLGDFVLALGAVRQLLDHFGPANCRLVISENAVALARREFPEIAPIVLPAFAQKLRDLLPVRRTWRAVLGQLACDDLVCLRHQGSPYRDLILNWLPARRRFVLRGPFSDRPVIPITHGVPGLGYPAQVGAGTSREMEAHRVVVAAAIGKPVSAAAIVPRLDAARSVPRISGRRRVVVAPFASVAPRDLPDGLIPQLARALAEEGELELVLTGSTAQESRLRALAQQSAGAGIRPVVDTSPPAELINLLADADLVVSAETAPAHLATALDRPLIAVLGGGHFGLLAPWHRSARQRWLQHAMPCYGCDWNCIHPELFCITGVSSARVIAAAREMLQVAA